jgi:hypothetical protein
MKLAKIAENGKIATAVLRLVVMVIHAKDT